MISTLFVVAPQRVLPALLAGALVGASALYGEGYFDDASDRRAFRALLLCFFLPALGALFSAGWREFFVYVEVSTVALFLMIARKRSDVALRYLAAQFAGASLLLAGVAGATLAGIPLFVPAPRGLLPFFILGLGVKAALPGLHFWLPEVHGTAPAPVSALLSGFAVKIGIFGLLAVSAHEPSYLLLPAGAFMALWGAFMSLLQQDVKRLLAYSTISQLGYIVAACGAGTSFGVAAALYHTTVHGLLKGMLFFCAGILEKVYGTKNLNELGGAATALPVTFALFLFAAATVIGLPGTPGFASKGLIKGALEAFPLLSFCFLIANVGTAASFFKMGTFAFGGVSKRTRDNISERLRLMNAGMLSIFAVLAPLSLFPGMLPLFLGVRETSFYSAAKCAESIFTAACGAVVLYAYQKRPEFGERLLNRLDGRTERFLRTVAKGSLLMRRMQSGLLRGYLFAAALAALVLMVFFSW